jgi:hypothetical protein
MTRLPAAVSFFASMMVDAEWLGLKQEMAWPNGCSAPPDYKGQKKKLLAAALEACRSLKQVDAR